jgi:hypothetical protein
MYVFNYTSNAFRFNYIFELSTFYVLHIVQSYKFCISLLNIGLSHPWLPRATMGETPATAKGKAWRHGSGAAQWWGGRPDGGMKERRDGDMDGVWSRMPDAGGGTGDQARSRPGRAEQATAMTLAWETMSLACRTGAAAVMVDQLGVPPPLILG